LYPIFHLVQGLFIMEKPAPVAVTILKHYLFQLYPAHESIPDVFSIVFCRIIQRVMQTATFFTTQCRIDNHCATVARLRSSKRSTDILKFQ